MKVLNYTTKGFLIAKKAASRTIQFLKHIIYYFIKGFIIAKKVVSSIATKGLSTAKKIISSIIHFFKRIISHIINWISQKKPLFLNIRSTIPILIIAYFISLSFLTGNKFMQIPGIILQVLAGMMLALGQIYNNPRIKAFMQQVIDKPQLFAFFVSLIIFTILFVFSLQSETSDLNIWQKAFGILFVVSMLYWVFIINIWLLNKFIKKRERTDELRISGEQVSFSLKHVSILFFISFILTIVVFVTIYFVFHDVTAHVTAFLLILGVYSLIIFPSFVISMIFISMYFLGRFFGWIRENEQRITNFWIMVFVFWTWGGLLLIINAFKT